MITIEVQYRNLVEAGSVSLSVGDYFRVIKIGDKPAFIRMLGDIREMEEHDRFLAAACLAVDLTQDWNKGKAPKPKTRNYYVNLPMWGIADTVEWWTNEDD